MLRMQNLVIGASPKKRVFCLQTPKLPIASVHRLRALGKIPLEIIEVQSGSYLGEDDIERF